MDFFFLSFFLSRIDVSWNEAAAQCENIGGHLPFFKRYAYEIIPQFNQRFEYIDALGPMEILSGRKGFGDITFIGLNRKV